MVPPLNAPRGAVGPVLLPGPDGDRPFDAAAIERELRAMWKTAAPERGALYRAALANVIVPFDPSRQAALDPVLVELTRRHPSRLFLVEPGASAGAGDGADPAPLRARTSALCHLRPGGGGLVCSEQIVLSAAPAARALVPSAVAALLVGDIPVIFLHLDDKEPDEEARALHAMADVVIEDSGTRGDAASMAAVWDRIGREGSGRVRDIAWARLMPWRELLAEVFDQPDGAAALLDVQDVVVEHGGASPPAGAWLLAAWLATRLGWRLKERRLNRFRFDGPRRAATVTFEREPDVDAASIVSVRVRSGSPHPLDVVVSHRGRAAAASIEFVAPRPRLLDRTFRYREFAPCLVGEIHRHEPNTTLDAAAALASRLAGAAPGSAA